MSVYDWPSSSQSSTGAVGSVSWASTMMTGSRWTISMATTGMRALQTCKRYMDTATMRKRGSKGTISRQVCVTSIRILRSGVRRKSHAPFWSSGRRGDPSTDCNRLHATFRERLAVLTRRGRARARRMLTVQHGLSLIGTVYNCCTPPES